MEIFSVIVKALVVMLYVLVSGYVLTFGKSGAGIKKDYLFFTVFVLLALWRL